MVFVLLTLTLTKAHPQNYPVPKLPTTTVSFRSHAIPLCEALTQVGETVSVKAVCHNISRKKMFQGNIKDTTISSMMDTLAQQYKLAWFYDGKHLSISNAGSIKTEKILLQKGTGAEFLDYLASQGLYQPRFSFLILTHEKGLVVKAPSPLLVRINKAKQLYQQMPAAQLKAVKAVKPKIRKAVTVKKNGSDMILTFILRHALAVDRKVGSGQDALVIPGVATLLQRLLNGDSSVQSAVNLPKLPAPGAMQPSQEALNRFPAPRSTPATIPIKSPQSPAKNSGAKSAFHIVADVRTNAVLIFGPQGYESYFRAVVEALDVPASLIEIQAAVIDIVSNDQSERGVDWRTRIGRALIGLGTAPSFSNLTQGGVAVGVSKDGSFGDILTTNSTKLMAAIRMLETEGTSKVQSRPSIVTLDNMEASIDLSESFFVRVESSYDASLYPVKVNTHLKVTPHILLHGDGDYAVRISVTIKDGSIDTASAEVDSIPRIRQNQITTQAVVKSTESLLIGGHYNTTQNVTTTSIPILGDIPLLGALFSYNTRENNSYERLFMLTPRIRPLSSNDAAILSKKLDTATP